MDVIHRAATASDWLDAAALLHDHIEWIRIAADLDVVAAQPALAREIDHLEDHYGGDDGELFLARWCDVAVGTVAVRHHSDGSAELKRMYLRPVARRRGLADRLVAAAVEAAERRGADHLWLETLPGVMDAAVAVYRRNGFLDTDGARRVLAVDGILVMVRPIRAGQRCA